MFIIYELYVWSYNADFARWKIACLGTVKLIKNAATDKHIYSGISIGFDARAVFSLPRCEFGKNTGTFGVYHILSGHVDIRKKILGKVLVLGKGPTDGLDDILQERLLILFLV